MEEFDELAQWGDINSSTDQHHFHLKINH
jgi:hypothetical protein